MAVNGSDAVFVVPGKHAANSLLEAVLRAPAERRDRLCGVQYHGGHIVRPGIDLRDRLTQGDAQMSNNNFKNLLDAVTSARGNIVNARGGPGFHDEIHDGEEIVDVNKVAHSP